MPTVDPSLAEGNTKELLERTLSQLGRVPNLHRTMASAPAALDAYLSMRGALVRGALDNAMRERLALLIAEENGCEYCVSAHVFRGAKVGLAPEELSANRDGASLDPKHTAALQFVRRVMHARGAVSDEELASVRLAGWHDAEIGEMVAHVALNIFANYFNHVSRPALDFPRVEVRAHG